MRIILQKKCQSLAAHSLLSWHVHASALRFSIHSNHVHSLYWLIFEIIWDVTRLGGWYLDVFLLFDFNHVKRVTLSVGCFIAGKWMLLRECIDWRAVGAFASGNLFTFPGLLSWSWTFIYQLPLHRHHPLLFSLVETNANLPSQSHSTGNRSVEMPLSVWLSAISGVSVTANVSKLLTDSLSSVFIVLVWCVILYRS